MCLRYLSSDFNSLQFAQSLRSVSFIRKKYWTPYKILETYNCQIDGESILKNEMGEKYFYASISINKHKKFNKSNMAASWFYFGHLYN